jgi:hypothetical protein
MTTASACSRPDHAAARWAVDFATSKEMAIDHHHAQRGPPSTGRSSAGTSHHAARAFVSGHFRDGLRISAKPPDAAVQYQAPGDYPAEQIILFLVDCEGGKDESVQLPMQGNKRVSAQWRDGKIPQIVEYDLLTPKDEGQRWGRRQLQLLWPRNGVELHDFRQRHRHPDALVLHYG